MLASITALPLRGDWKNYYQTEFELMLLTPICHFFRIPEDSERVEQRRRAPLCTAAIIAISALISGCTSSQLPSSLDSDQAGNANNRAIASTDKPLEEKPTAMTKIENDTIPIESPYENMDELSYQDNTITATVVSTGCTRDDHFTVEHTIVGDTCELLVVRDKPDNCRAAPFRQSISVDWNKELACEDRSLVFLNPPLAPSEINTIKKLSK